MHARSARRPDEAFQDFFTISLGHGSVGTACRCDTMFLQSPCGFVSAECESLSSFLRSWYAHAYDDPPSAAVGRSEK